MWRKVYNHYRVYWIYSYSHILGMGDRWDQCWFSIDKLMNWREWWLLPRANHHTSPSFLKLFVSLGFLDYDSFKTVFLSILRTPLQDLVLSIFENPSSKSVLYFWKPLFKISFSHYFLTPLISKPPSFLTLFSFNFWELVFKNLFYFFCWKPSFSKLSFLSNAFFYQKPFFWIFFTFPPTIPFQHHTLEPLYNHYLSKLSFWT